MKSDFQPLKPMNSETRNCRNCKTEFTIEPDDFSFYEKIQIPPPAKCPDCRFQARLSFRNNRVFYKRQCALCGAGMLTVYHPSSPFTVYCRECWLSDKWDPMQYGRPYDFSIPFFAQFQSLQRTVPRPNLYRTNFQNSDYCNYGLDFKDCYLLFGGRYNERVHFANQIFNSHDSFDIAYSSQVEFGYELFECRRVNRLFYSHHSNDCLNSYYLVDCHNCQNCFGCVNLRNKQYHIWNVPHAKEEYEAFLRGANVGSYTAHQGFSARLRELVEKNPRRYAHILKGLNSDGDDIYEVKNVHDSFASGEAEDSRFLFYLQNKSKDCYDCSFQGWNAEKLYQICHGFGGMNVQFGVRNLYNQDALYNEECHNSANIFGCEGLRKKQYCVLNVQYPKEEYESLKEKIIEHMKKTGEWGEFFPIALSPFAYNETIAQEFFPLIKESAITTGFTWREDAVRNYQITLATERISDDIKGVPDSVLSEVVACAHGGACLHQCTTAFKITKEEIQFYRSMSLPLPRLCPNCRHYERLGQRNPLKLWKRQCMCNEVTSDKDQVTNKYKNTAAHFHGNSPCSNEFKTTYAPERKEIVYCEQCYQAEVA